MVRAVHTMTAAWTTATSRATERSISAPASRPARMMLAFDCADVFARRSLLKFSVIQ